MNPYEFIRVTQAAKELGVSYTTIYVWMTEGRLSDGQLHKLKYEMVDGKRVTTRLYLVEFMTAVKFCRATVRYSEWQRWIAGVVEGGK